MSRQLHWSHFLELIYLKDSLTRDFYVQMCGIERWSVRTLRNFPSLPQKPNGALFALACKVRTGAR
ncbi:DUF1016 N-terminal domain-containing protein [Endozoicomonas sp. 8E]|nr:DUF1016 N-terminal domain-containing protein [Endozoicomonas sp. 8E]